MNRDTTAANAFYLARDRRTFQYGAVEEALERPIALQIAIDVAGTAAGQTAARALADMLARAHRRIRIEAPAVALIGEASATLDQRLRQQLMAIDPFQDPARPPAVDEIQVVITARPEEHTAAHIATGWHGGRGEVHIVGVAPKPYRESPSESPDVQSTNESEDLLGAATAACLAAAAAFVIAHQGLPSPAAVNLLERTESVDASYATISGPLDVGSVMVLGAGAVAHALAFWLREWGHAGDWEFVDKDAAELHNTNRCMGMTASAAGWPDGLPLGTPENKAVSAASLIGARANPRWFHDLPLDRPRPDLHLVLANEYGVRAQAAGLGDAILLHATTSANWTAELHRHLAGIDDCPACRIPEASAPRFACSSGAPVPADQGSGDAALPFLSAAAGLMLVVALLDLAHDRTMLRVRHNHWRLNLELAPRLWQRLPHRNDSCPHQLDEGTRSMISAEEPRRWDDLRRGD